MSRFLSLATVYRPDLQSWTVIAIGTGNTVDDPNSRPRNHWDAVQQMREFHQRHAETKLNLRLDRHTCS